MPISHPLGLALLLLLPACGTLTYYDPGDSPDEGGGAGDDDDDDVSTPEEPGPDPTIPAEDCEDSDDCANPDCAAWCDVDGDGRVSAELGGDDCDDTNEAVYPGAPEVCDQVDNDCDQDVDGDGDGDGAAVCDDCDDADPTRVPGVADYCGDGIDADCDTADCITWSDDFESGMLSATWGTAGVLPWTVSTASVGSGTFSARSGPVVDLQTSGLMLTVNFPAGGKVSFSTSGEAENTWDYLRFYIDGVERDNWTGQWLWQDVEFLVPAGAHTFSWVYDKDELVTHGLDSGFIDDVTFEGGMP